MSGTLFQIKDLDRLRFLLDLPQLSYFPSTFIYGALDNARTRLDFIAYPDNLTPTQMLHSFSEQYSTSKHIEKSIGLFLTKEAARIHYPSLSTWSRQNKRHLVLLEYQNDKLVKLLCVSPIKAAQREHITQVLDAIRERYLLEETTPKPRLVLPEINAQEFNAQKHYHTQDTQSYLEEYVDEELKQLENIERQDPHQKIVKAYQHKI